MNAPWRREQLHKFQDEFYQNELVIKHRIFRKVEDHPKLFNFRSAIRTKMFPVQEEAIKRMTRTFSVVQTTANRLILCVTDVEQIQFGFRRQ